MIYSKEKCPTMNEISSKRARKFFESSSLEGRKLRSTSLDFPSRPQARNSQAGSTRNTLLIKERKLNKWNKWGRILKTNSPFHWYRGSLPNARRCFRMEGALTLIFWKSETSRDIKKYFFYQLNIFKSCIDLKN